MLLDRSIDEVVDEPVRQKIYSVAGCLGQRKLPGWEWSWRAEVKSIVEAARSNDIALEALPGMGAASWKEMEAELGSPTTDNLDELLLNQIAGFPAEAANSKVGVTRKYWALINAFKERIREPGFAWSNWEKLVTARPKREYKDEALAVAAMAERVGEHPRLHRHLEQYISVLFDLGRQAGEHFAKLKAKQGVADYPDLEKATLDLLRNDPGVREVLRDEIDLLLVDEFQDTSPIQLALFAELGKLADRVIWVGDVKQSIYGFRGSDPGLVFEAVQGAERKETLGESWRSVPDLVKLTNNSFAGPFNEAIGLPEEETKVAPHRQTPPGLPPAIEIGRIVQWRG